MHIKKKTKQKQKLPPYPSTYITNLLRVDNILIQTCKNTKNQTVFIFNLN